MSFAAAAVETGCDGVVVVGAEIVIGVGSAGGYGCVQTHGFGWMNAVAAVGGAEAAAAVVVVEVEMMVKFLLVA